MTNLIETTDFNKKLGYYVCNGIDFRSKISACIYSTRVNKPVSWIFNDDVFNKHDWTIEPTETLDELYDRRSRELREKYDYIILSYSAGADSNNIYESFKRQGLHIDEIVVNTMTKASEKFITVDVNNLNATDAPESEHQLLILPRLRQIRNECPNTKISIYDLSDHLFDSLGSADDPEWVLKMKEGLNPIGITRFNYMSFSNVKRTLDKGKSAALITGIEKLRVIITDDRRLVVRFTDKAANISAVQEHVGEYENCTVEYFYWAPECTQMLIKQGHVIKRYLEAFPHQQIHWLGKLVIHDPSIARLIHEPILRKVLYSTWNPTWYQAKKATLTWYSEFDQWFFTHYKDTKAYQNWNAGLDYVKANAGSFLMFDRSINSIDGLHAMTQYHDLGPMARL